VVFQVLVLPKKRISPVTASVRAPYSKFTTHSRVSGSAMQYSVVPVDINCGT
jgi:hypothetical protein